MYDSVLDQLVNVVLSVFKIFQYGNPVRPDTVVWEWMKYVYDGNPISHASEFSIQNFWIPFVDRCSWGVREYFYR